MTSEPDPRPLTVGDVVAVLDGRYPPRLAEQWDRNGLLCGDPGDPVHRVLLAVDLTDDVIAEASTLGCDMVLTHHPLLLRGVGSVATTTPKGRRVTALVRAGIAAWNAHTPADSATPGVSDALAGVLGLQDVRPLDPRPLQSLDKVVAFVPPGHLTQVVDALAQAGAGAIGNYDRCHFAGAGTGSFRPLTGADPFIGDVGAIEQVAETRLEMVAPRAARDAVVAALLATHPYEEPAYDVIPLADVAVTTGIGRVGRLAQPVAARELAATLAAGLPATVGGVRIGGDPERMVTTVAVLAGAGDSHLDAARHAGADAYVTSDLRHHPAEEALAWTDAPVLIDVPHWAAEWAWLPHLAAAVRTDCPGLDVIVSEIRTEPWTLRV